MNEALRYAKFVTHLQLEQSTVRTFVETLQKEQDSLAEENMEDLDFLASEKERIVEQLTDFNEQRNQYLTSQELETNPEGMKKLLSIDGEHGEISIIWNETIRLIDFAHQLNKTNGAIITARLQYAQRTLAALQCAAGATALYGPKGQALGNSDNGRSTNLRQL